MQTATIQHAVIASDKSVPLVSLPRVEVGPRSGVSIPVPDDPKIPLEKRCTYSGPDDDKHTACAGKWRPWTAFNKNKNKFDHLQAQCRLCVALYKRNLRSGRTVLRKGKHTQKPKRVKIMSTPTFPAVLKPIPITSRADVVPTSAAPTRPPTLAELQRVGAYLLNIHIAGEEVANLKDKVEELKRELRSAKDENTQLLADIAGLRTNLAAAELFRDAERTALALAEEVENGKKQVDTALALQKEYQRRLFRAGTIVPKHFCLLDVGEIKAILDGED